MRTSSVIIDLSNESDASPSQDARNARHRRPGLARRPTGASRIPDFRNITNDVADLEQLPDASSETNTPTDPNLPFSASGLSGGRYSHQGRSRVHPLSREDVFHYNYNIERMPEMPITYQYDQEGAYERMQEERAWLVDLPESIGFPPDSQPLLPAPDERTVQEDDVAACPNCDHKLGTGNELKRQT
jgi:hypothetical protein